MAGPSTVFHSLRLPALKFNDAEPTIIRSYCEEMYRLLLETLNAHQAATQRTINPKDDTKNLRRLAISHYILKLLEDAESTLPLPSSCGLTLEQRVKRIQDHLNMRECPQPKRPDVTASQALNQLQHYKNLGADYENWSPDEPLDEPPLHALCFASRAFGALHYKLPPDMSHEDPCLPLLIPLYNWHYWHLIIMKNHHEQCTEDLFFTYGLIPLKETDQVGAPEAQALDARLAGLNSDPLKDLLYRLQYVSYEVNGPRVIGLATYG
ncbi:hypothetical protein CDV36_014365 [Fusarium kuroshium]|uniref:Uncharacterized protein n=1 Tax=Fusarium kuroshium TaxID=2010991 RepID=A0A3M2RI40_9HYPO|nr:hypothetical protein CDV36_014365 [Fusarium kuroshium]